MQKLCCQDMWAEQLKIETRQLSNDLKGLDKENIISLIPV